MRIRASIACGALVLVAAASFGCGSLFRQYEYEEDVYLSLDGTATVYVNSSIAALDALRGAPFDARPAAPVDRQAIARYYASPITRVGRISTSRRAGRQFVHVRVDVDDIRRLGESGPFAWSSYQFAPDGEQLAYRQTIGRAAAAPAASAGWTGRELVAFRLHLPSRIAYHNALTSNFKRGNILVWEQPLSDRLAGKPLVLEARVENRSILYTTTLLFAATLVVVALSFAGIIWFVVRLSKNAPLEPKVIGRKAQVLPRE